MLIQDDDPVEMPELVLVELRHFHDDIHPGVQTLVRLLEDQQ